MQLDMDGVTYMLQWLVYAAKVSQNPQRSISMPFCESAQLYILVGHFGM